MELVTGTKHNRHQRFAQQRALTPYYGFSVAGRSTQPTKVRKITVKTRNPGAAFIALFHSSRSRCSARFNSLAAVAAHL